MREEEENRKFSDHPPCGGRERRYAREDIKPWGGNSCSFFIFPKRKVRIYTLLLKKGGEERWSSSHGREIRGTL